MKTVDTATGALRMTSSVNSLVEYLKYLHLFGETFGLHPKSEAPLAIEITPAIERLELVYRFDQECVDNVKIVTGTHSETQGPQGTVSSVVIEGERRLLKSLRKIEVLLNRFSPGLSARFNTKSILWKTRFLRCERVQVTCRCSFTLSRGSVEQSKNA